MSNLRWTYTTAKPAPNLDSLALSTALEIQFETQSLIRRRRFATALQPPSERSLYLKRANTEYAVQSGTNENPIALELRYARNISTTGPAIEAKALEIALVDARHSLEQGVSPHAETAQISLTQSFQYQRLIASDSIRILEISPGVSESPIDCNLQQVKLSDQPFYNALSYHWGNERATVEIRCSGMTLVITKTLHDAIVRIRHPKETRVLWADAICINQENVEERNGQVQLMSQIYKQAAKVLIWVGNQHTHLTDTAFPLICQIVNSFNPKLRDFKTATYRKSAETSVFPAEPYSELRNVPDESWAALCVFFNLPWFWRLWVIQEIALASSAELMWGGASIDWRWVGLASALIRTNEVQILRRNDLDGVYNAYLMHRISLREDYFGPVSFLRMLELTRQFEVTNPKDRIFGMLALPTTDSNPQNGALFLQPNYTLSDSELYRILAERVLEKDKTLRLLCSVQHGPELDENLPSWVPQWHKVFNHHLAPSDPDTHHTPAGGRQIHRSAPRSGDPHHLVLRGLEFDIVEDQTDTLSNSHFYRILDDATEYKSKREALVNEIQALWPSYKSAEGLKALCWTLTAGKDWYGLLVENDAGHFRDFVAFLQGWNTLSEDWYSGVCWSTQDIPNVDRFCEAAANACTGRRLFRTANKFLGLGPQAMRTGDQVCILFGGLVPFVLRPERGYWRFIGECYVYGIMQGQAVEAWQKEATPATDFELR